MPARRPLPPPELAATAVGTWLGMQALRTFFGAVAWNIRENLPDAFVPLSILSVAAAGALAGPVAGRFGGPRPEVRLAVTFSLLWLASRTVPHSQAGALLAVAAMAAWFCWMPAWLTALARREASGALVPGVILGLTADVGLRMVLYGLDLPVLGTAGTVATAALAALLVGSVSSPFAVPGTRLVVPSEPPADGNSELGTLNSELPGGAWGPVVLGPFLFLQLGLLANPGRVEVLSGWSYLGTAAFVLAGLLVVAALPRLPAWLGLAAPAAIGLLLLSGSRQAWLLLPAQVGALAALAHAMGRTHPSGAGSYRGWVVGTLLFFLLTVLFYSAPRFGWRGAWVVAGALLALPVLRAGGMIAGVRAALPWAVPATAVTLALAWLLRPIPQLAGTQAPVELKVLTYNIHYGFDPRGRPVMPELAAFIETRAPDLVALQEIGRGDPMFGGLDLVAYLRRRLPGYQVVYQSTYDDLSGNAVLSRYPVRDSGRVLFPLREDAIVRGLTWVTVPGAGGEVLFGSTHFSGFRDRDHTLQAEDLVAFWSGRPRTLIGGDFNAPPGSPPERRLQGAGLVDLAAAAGQGGQPTFRIGRRSRRLDYVWGSPDLQPLAAEVPRIALSDHLPVLVTVGRSSVSRGQ